MISYKHKEVIPITGYSLQAQNQMRHPQQKKQKAKGENLNVQEIGQDKKAKEKNVSADFDS